MVIAEIFVMLFFVMIGILCLLMFLEIIRDRRKNKQSVETLQILRNIEAMMKKDKK